MIVRPEFTPELSGYITNFKKKNSIYVFLRIFF